MLYGVSSFFYFFNAEERKGKREGTQREWSYMVSKSVDLLRIF